MKEVSSKNIKVKIDKGTIVSLKIGKRECCFGSCPLFAVRLRNEAGEAFIVDAFDAVSVNETSDSIEFSGFKGDFGSLTVQAFIKELKDSISWKISVDSVPDGYAVEWVEFPKICMPRLVDNNIEGGTILFPYDEGILITNESLLPRYEPEFPSSGAYFMFPNKVCSQFLAYLFDNSGLYIGAHDAKRALKGVDFYQYNDGLSLQMRLYTGGGFGNGFKMDYPIIWNACQGSWKDACDIYRSWFQDNLPKGVVPVKENEALPKWYEDPPVIVTYPVRGVHDMDKMEPNALFPYKNALPILEEIKKETGCHIMSLLMHWEGTAPWAPPYVWPPFGGLDAFNEFRDELHKNGDLLGVYCSGFGYTLKSTLIESYNCEERIKQENVLEGVCHSPSNKPELGITCCPYQRYGYDICPASDTGRKILDEAYSPIFSSGVDYAQILDQNHGGGQYLCYAKEHNHPPMPGEWMTFNMQGLLSEWCEKAPSMLFGCESAAAEPFIGYLLMNDNRFELNYPFGTPVPAFSYIYHEYIRNFMGNQCGCPFEPTVDTLRYRLAYSFSIGDIMTLIIAPNGDLMTHWGNRDFEHYPDKSKALSFIKNVMKFYSKEGKDYLYGGRMKNAPDIECDSIVIPLFRGQKTITLPRLLCSTWEAKDGKTAYIVVNPEDTPVDFKLSGEKYSCPPLDAMLITI